MMDAPPRAAQALEDVLELGASAELDSSSAVQGLLELVRPLLWERLVQRDQAEIHIELLRVYGSAIRPDHLLGALSRRRTSTPQQACRGER